MTPSGDPDGSQRGSRPDEEGSNEAHWRADRWLDSKIARYFVSGIGPVIVAGTHLILSLTLLRLMTPRDFGTFSFLFITAQLSWGLASALFCAPLQVLLVAPDAGERERGEAALFDAVLCASAIGLFVALAIASLSGLSLASALFYSVFCGISVMRWFGRAWSYSYSKPLRTTASDIAYSFGTLATLALLLLAFGLETELAIQAALAAGAAAGFGVFGWSYIVAQVCRTLGHLRFYPGIWRQHSRWAVLGVATTEITANAHIYAVMALHGPAAYAPIAASSLLLRPVNVAQNALTEFERPQMARLIAQRDSRLLARTMFVFRSVLFAVWLSVTLFSAALFAIDPYLLFPTAYDSGLLLTAVALWTGVAAIILLLTPDATMLQAAGEFRALAFATVWSSVVSLTAVVTLLFLAGPIWTIAGIGLGWVVNFLLIRSAAKRWHG